MEKPYRPKDESIIDTKYKFKLEILEKIDFKMDPDLDDDYLHESDDLHEFGNPKFKNNFDRPRKDYYFSEPFGGNMNPLGRRRYFDKPSDVDKFERSVAIAELTDRLISILLKHLGSPSRSLENWDPEHSLQDIVRLEDGVVKGQTNLCKNASWCTNMVHSSDLMSPATILMRELVGNEDDVESIDSFRISGLIKREMTLYGKRNGELKDVLGRETDSPSFTVKFTTQKGENVVIAGYQTGEDIPVTRNANEILDKTTRLFIYNVAVRDEVRFPILSPTFDDSRKSHDRYFIPLNEKNKSVDAATPELIAPLGGRLGTPIDIVISAMQTAREKIIGKIPVRNDYALAAGFESFKIPELKDLVGGGMLVVKMPDPATVKVTKVGYMIVPVHFKFVGIKGNELGGGIYNMALPKTEDAGMRQYGY